MKARLLWTFSMLCSNFDCYFSYVVILSFYMQTPFNLVRFMEFCWSFKTPTMECQNCWTIFFLSRRWLIKRSNEGKLIWIEFLTFFTFWIWKKNQNQTNKLRLNKVFFLLFLKVCYTNMHFAQTLYAFNDIRLWWQIFLKIVKISHWF